MDKIDRLKQLKILYTIPVIVALFAVLPINSFEFYMFVRWVMFSGFILSIGLFIINKDLFLLGILSLLGALDFNPFNITTATKSWWVMADIFSAAFFGLLIYLTQQEIEKTKNELKEVAKKPKISQAVIDNSRHEWLEKINIEDKKILERRQKNKITDKHLLEMSKDPMQYKNSSFFTSKERENNQRNMTRKDNLNMLLGLILIVAVVLAIIYIPKIIHKLK